MMMANMKPNPIHADALDSITCNRVIVSGASGFVGRHVVDDLLKKGYEVIALVRNVEKAMALNWPESVKVVQFDLANKLDPLAIPPCGKLIHCAWDNVRDTQSMEHIEEHYAKHYAFIKHFIEKGVNKVVVIGSCYEYGLQYGPVLASQATKPNTPYALAKDFLHQSLRLLQNQNSFELLWVRLFYVYGEGQDPKSIIPLFDRALENGDQVFNMSFGEQLFDYLPIELAANQINLLLKKSNGVFNVCSGQPISLRRLLEKRMKEKNKDIELNLGYYDYRKQDSLAIWGADPFMDNA